MNSSPFRHSESSVQVERMHRRVTKTDSSVAPRKKPSTYLSCCGAACFSGGTQLPLASPTTSTHPPPTQHLPPAVSGVAGTIGFTIHINSFIKIL